jgi:hypothetical protein
VQKKHCARVNGLTRWRHIATDSLFCVWSQQTLILVEPLIKRHGAWTRHLTTQEKNFGCFVGLQSYAKPSDKSYFGYVICSMSRLLRCTPTQTVRGHLVHGSHHVVCILSLFACDAMHLTDLLSTDWHTRGHSTRYSKQSLPEVRRLCSIPTKLTCPLKNLILRAKHFFSVRLYLECRKRFLSADNGASNLSRQSSSE